MEINYNLHNHTYRCKHATGTSEDMVMRAIDENIRNFGISEHIPYSDANASSRPDFSEKDAYLDELQFLRKKYADKIILYRGFEAEYQKRHLDYLKQLFVNDQIDYLILGQHNQDVSNRNSYFGFHRSLSMMKEYVNLSIEGMKTGLFLFQAHPDVAFELVSNLTDDYLKEMRRLIAASIKYEVPLEYNGGGVRKALLKNISFRSHRYPRYEFWQLVLETDAKVVVNSDAHHPDEINDNAYKIACEQAINRGLNVIFDIDWQKYKARVKNAILS